MANANKLSVEYLESRIKTVEYMQVRDRMIMCFITMVNGYEVTGEAYVADPANHVEEKGRRVAYNNAFDKLWSLEGYLLKERMMESV
jgi:hypothetical protein